MHSKLRLIYIGFVFLFCSCLAQQEKINGVSFVASPSKVELKDIEPLLKLSPNYVALMPFGFTQNVNSPKIIFNTDRQWFGETKLGLLQYGTAFKKQRIKIMVKPQLWIWNGAYTGLLSMNSNENWSELELSYEQFILFYAKVAEELNADIFCIGTELEQFVINRPLFWSNLIVKIRNIYSGKLTYAANWDEFKRISFWTELDYIGIDAYFPLSNNHSPSVEEFEKGWKPHKEEVIKIQKVNKKPVLFTEYGYRSINYNGKEPWKADVIEGEINLTNQQKAIEAIYNQFWNEEWFAGGFLWKWFLKHDEVGGEKNNQFTPQNKPTEQTLKKLYQNYR